MPERNYSSCEIDDMNFIIHCTICETFISNEADMYISRKLGNVTFKTLKQSILNDCIQQNVDPNDDCQIVKLVKANTLGTYSIN